MSKRAPVPHRIVNPLPPGPPGGLAMTGLRMDDVDVEIRCAECGALAVVRSRVQRFCSEECYRVSRNRRQRVAWARRAR